MEHGNSLAVQWLGLLTFTAKGLGSISGQGTKTPRHVVRLTSPPKKQDHEGDGPGNQGQGPEVKTLRQWPFLCNTKCSSSGCFPQQGGRDEELALVGPGIRSWTCRSLAEHPSADCLCQAGLALS